MKEEQRNFGKIIQDIFSAVLTALLIAVILKVFFIGSSIIISSSMEKSLMENDHVLVWKFLYNKKIPVFNKSFLFGISIKRKDIIVFKSNDKKDDFVKRVIGLPGDKILLLENKVFVNGILLKEPYINNKNNLKYINSVYEVPKKMLFVMGDNRNKSRDSREFDCINTSSIIGKVFFIFYPFKRINKL